MLFVSLGLVPSAFKTHQLRNMFINAACISWSSSLSFYYIFDKEYILINALCISWSSSLKEIQRAFIIIFLIKCVLKAQGTRPGDPKRYSSSNMSLFFIRYVLKSKGTRPRDPNRYSSSYMFKSLRD